MPHKNPKREYELTPEFIAWYEGSRRGQGLPLHVEDPVILDEVAKIFTEHRRRRRDEQQGRRG